MACRADKNASRHFLVLGRILANEYHPSAAVQAAAMEDRPPLRPEVGGGVDVAAGILSTELIEWRLKVAWIKINTHQPLPPFSDENERAIKPEYRQQNVDCGSQASAINVHIHDLYVHALWFPRTLQLKAELVAAGLCTLQLKSVAQPSAWFSECRRLPLLFD
jgi:hypothetical protein